MKKNHKPILIYILVVVILGLFIYTVPKVTDVLEATTVIETGTLQVTEEADCYFVRHEAVYEAGAAGTVEYKIKEGTHIKTGTSLADFKADDNEGSDVMAARSKYAEIIENVGDDAVKTVSFESKSSGVVSYYADGYESILTPETMDKFSREKAMEIEDKPVELKQSPVRKSEPVLKICDNDNWYIMCWVESASIANYEVGKTVSIGLPSGTVDMKVESIAQDGDYWKIVFWSNNYYEDFAKTRVAEGLLISKDYTGLVTETSNIITDGKQPVVLVLQQNGEYRIVKVKVKANNGEFSALAEVSYIDENGNQVDTVNIYDEIMRNPDQGDLDAIREREAREAKEAQEGE